jgi:hypothetical protein
VTTPNDVSFVIVAGSWEQGGDVNVSTRIAWLQDGFAVLKLQTYHGSDEPILAAELTIVDRIGHRRQLPSIRFEDDGQPKEEGRHRIVSMDELYAASEHGDREETILGIAAVLVAKDVSE